MKVATWRGGSRFTLDEAPEPAPGPGQALVAVRAAGICGTDVHATQGLFPWTPPLVLGHEYTGVVQDVGRGVSRRLVGKAVACEPSYGCGKCAECAEGRISQCARATRVGGFAERVALPVAALVAVALFSSVLAYIFWNRGVEQVGAPVAGLFVHLMPVFGIVLAWLVLDERLAPFHLLGIALILTGITITSRKARAVLPAAPD